MRTIVRIASAMLLTAATLLIISISSTSVASAAFTANPSTVDFGSTPLGVPATVPVTLTLDPGGEVGYLSVPGSQWSVSSPPSGGCTGFTASALDATCTLDLSFTPQSVGSLSNSQTFQEFENGPLGLMTIGTLTIDETGDGVSNFAATPTSVDFGNVPLGTTATVPVTVTFDSGYSRSLVAEETVWGQSSPATGGCDGFVGPGTCVVDLSFDPNAVGAQTNVVNVGEEISGVNGPDIGIDESGVGTSALAATPTSVDFGKVPLGTTATVPVTVTFDSGYSRSPVAEETVWGQSGPATGGCGDFVGPGSCVVDLSFDPNAVGAQTNVVNVGEEISGVNGPDISIDESGVGVSKFAASATSVGLGDTLEGQEGTRSVTITLDSGYQLAPVAVATGDAWQVTNPTKNGCSGVTGPARCTLDLGFIPKVNGQYTNALKLRETLRLGQTQTLSIHEKGFGVRCRAGRIGRTFSSLSSPVVTGLFCLKPSGHGTYTQRAVDGRPARTGVGSVERVGKTTVIKATGPHMALRGTISSTTSHFAESKPVPAKGKFVLGAR